MSSDGLSRNRNLGFNYGTGLLKMTRRKKEKMEKWLEEKKREKWLENGMARRLLKDPLKCCRDQGLYDCCKLVLYLSCYGS